MIPVEQRKAWILSFVVAFSVMVWVYARPNPVYPLLKFFFFAFVVYPLWLASLGAIFTRPAKYYAGAMFFTRRFFEVSSLVLLAVLFFYAVSLVQSIGGAQ